MNVCVQIMALQIRFELAEVLISSEELLLGPGRGIRASGF
jgi:hypothetical protein